MRAPPPRGACADVGGLAVLERDVDDDLVDPGGRELRQAPARARRCGRRPRRSAARPGARRDRGRPRRRRRASRPIGAGELVRAELGQRLLREPAVADPPGAAESDGGVAADRAAGRDAPASAGRATPAGSVVQIGRERRRARPSSTHARARSTPRAAGRDPRTGRSARRTPLRASRRRRRGAAGRRSRRRSTPPASRRRPAAATAARARLSRSSRARSPRRSAPARSEHRSTACRSPMSARPSSANGYQDSMACGSTMWSLTQSDSNPAASSSAAMAPMPSRAGSGPLFGTLAPILIVIASPVPSGGSSMSSHDAQDWRTPAGATRSTQSHALSVRQACNRPASERLRPFRRLHVDPAESAAYGSS